MKVTVGLEHEPGEELQLDWLELSETPWGEKAYVLVGALSHSGRVRGVFADGHDVRASDRSAWTACCAGSAARRSRGGPTGWRRSSTRARTGCGRRRPRRRSTTASPSRCARRTGRSARASWRRRSTTSRSRGGARRRCPRRRRRRPTWTAGASRSPTAVGAARARSVSSPPQSRCSGLPELAFPAEHQAERVVADDALVAFESNRYSVAPSYAAQTVTVRARLGRDASGDLLAGRPADRPAPPRPERRRPDRALTRARQAARTGRARCVHQPQGVPAQTEPAARRTRARRGRPPARPGPRRRGCGSRSVRPDREGRRQR